MEKATAAATTTKREKSTAATAVGKRKTRADAVKKQKENIKKLKTDVNDVLTDNVCKSDETINRNKLKMKYFQQEIDILLLKQRISLLEHKRYFISNDGKKLDNLKMEKLKLQLAILEEDSNLILKRENIYRTDLKRQAENVFLTKLRENNLVQKKLIVLPKRTFDEALNPPIPKRMKK